MRMYYNFEVVLYYIYIYIYVVFGGNTLHVYSTSVFSYNYSGHELFVSVMT